MSDNPTRETSDSRSFEERVFARFDALDARMDRLDGRMDRFESRLGSLEDKVDGVGGRVTALEEKVDARLRETRPIWEGVLARLDNIEAELAFMNRQFRAFVADIFQLRARVEKLEEDNDKRTA
jgi:predicted nuclease with TOPRIM domain